jgi:NDP-sugar pyrophosphorylase family protein
VINIVVPMAGLGTRFADAGFVLPKPLIPIHDTPMIELVIRNLAPPQPHRFIFVCQREHVRAYALAAALTRWAPGCEIIQIDGVTEGAACTVLTARELINSDEPLLIANSDQYVEADVCDFLVGICNGTLDGVIVTMTADDPKWSFVETDDAGLVQRVVEKEVISDQATVGIYGFARGVDFVAAADAMIAANKRVNGEFYVAPVYEELIAAGARIGVHGVGSVGSGMYGLGTPADLADFLAADISRQVAG